MSLGRKFFLQGIDGPFRGREFLILGEEVRMGRTPENDIVLNQSSISRHHASLWVQAGELWIEDMQSKNGVFVNDEKISSHPLRADDVVRVGDHIFKVGVEKIKDSPVKKLQPILLQGAPKAQELFHRIGAKRIAMYGVAFSVLLYGYSLSQKSAVPELAAKTENPLEHTTLTMPADASILEARDASKTEVLTWQARAELAIKYDDVNAAIPLLRKILAARPDDEKAQSQLARAQSRLAILIHRYDESAAKEFEKRYYENAMIQWRKVLSLSQGFDPETYKRTQSRIREVEAKLKQ